jgi:uncharacterized protein YbaR (Trm112 family)
MELDQELIDILRCPKCKGELKVEDEAFVCEPCRLRYAVVDGIPNFILEEAQPLEEE